MLRWFVLATLCCLPLLLRAEAVSSFKQTVKVNGRAFAVTGVRVDLKDPRVQVKAGLAYGHVGRTEGLAGIAQRYGAVAAINGSFFDAYTKNPLKNPDMTLISGGLLAFKSNIGCLLGFAADNTPRIGCVRHKLTGTVTSPDGHRQFWHAYWVNRKPTSSPCVTIFTRQWGEKVEPFGGVSVVVDAGKVTAITGNTVAIPADGFVLNINGERTLLGRFQVGSTVVATPEVTAEGDPAAWAGVREGIGAGPRVLAAGTPVFNPKPEGFNDPKILTNCCARSAVGFTADRVLVLITTCSAKVSDLGHILKALGCVEGMNLDGGASSGLWYNDAYLTAPGRQISNALVVTVKK